MNNYKIQLLFADGKTHEIPFDEENVAQYCRGLLASKDEKAIRTGGIFATLYEKAEDHARLIRTEVFEDTGDDWLSLNIRDEIIICPHCGKSRCIDNPEPKPDIPICPHCGKTRNTMINSRVWGWVKVYFGSGGWRYETVDDEVNYSDSAVVRCDNCEKVRTDIALVENRIELKRLNKE